MKINHELKCMPQYFHAVGRREKPFELRKNDRDFQVGDVLTLREWQPDGGTEGGGYYTGDFSEHRVTYILHGPAFGLEGGYCIMTIEPVGVIKPQQV